MADRGAGLSIGVGLIIVNFVAWLFSFSYDDHSARAVRILVACAASLYTTIWFLASARGCLPRSRRMASLVPAGVLLLIALVPLPHGAFSIWLSLILLSVVSLVSWLHDLPALKKSLRLVAVPWFASQLLFFIAFLFFTNVRSYIPFATFELSLYQAEKWGNYTHLQSAFTTSHMPPRDIWYHGEPTNYYYGGHLLVATIAKATGTAVRIAFNLGLATIFALTISMGFSFVLSLAHLTTRKLRLFGPVVWHHGMLWGLFGALAIGMFGNLDSWRQILTRDVDYGVQIRAEGRLRAEQEQWKLATGIPASTATAVYTASTTGDYYQRPENTRSEINRASTEAQAAAQGLKGLASRIRQATSTGPGDKEGAVSAILFTPEADALLRTQNAEPVDTAKEELFQLIVKERYEDAAKYIDDLATRQRDVSEKYTHAAAKLEGDIQKAIDSSAVHNVLKILQDKDSEDMATRILAAPRADTEWRLVNALKKKSFSETGVVLSDFQKAVDVARSAVQPADADFIADLQRALAAMAIDPLAVVKAEWGGFPPIQRASPTAEDLRFTWDNVAYIDFWQPSRAIKSAPAGVMEPGTITEFPYFSAILGDLHPHHMAIPFSLAALCACLSLIRKNSRLRVTEREFWTRSIPELGAMSFFIAAVFPVNIWDAVVLAPLYGVVLILARRKVIAWDGWRWVGMAGFAVLLMLVIGIPWNSIPGTAPLFQNFKFYALALFIIVPGIVLLPSFLPRVSRNLLVAGVVAAALVLVALGAMMAPGAGGTGPRRAVAAAMRDLLVFGAIAGLAAWWSIRNARARSLWWYSVGAIYAIVGIGALIMILPFQLWFQSPLTPENKMFFSVAPPFLSYDLVNSSGNFWDVFWKASPINPFQKEIRTELRDFIEHWGIFFFPVLIFAISRYFRVARSKPPGFTFMITMIVLGVVGYTRNYLGFWVGPISLAMVILGIYYAMEFRQRTESAAWIFLSVAFFWTWFVEALHFNDDYSGNYERYNTPFKIYYPLWAIFAGGMVVAVKEGLARFRFRDRSPSELLFSVDIYLFAGLFGIVATLLFQRIFPRSLSLAWFYAIWIPCALVLLVCVLSHTRRQPGRLAIAVASEASRSIAAWPALVAAVIILIIGMHYPVAATATRTREFFHWPLAGMSESGQPFRSIFMNRTLDAIAHLGEYPQYRHDYQAITWLEKNVKKGTMILERSGEDPYSSVGRMSTGSGLPTVVGWGHHEHQWRGRSAPAPHSQKVEYQDEVQNLQDLNAPFGQVLTVPDDVLTSRTQLELRMADGGTRLKELREIFPNATLMELYRLRRIVEQQDINVQLVMDAMIRHVQEMYTSTDKQRVQQLFGRYGIKYVVVGDLERKKYGALVDDRFRNWNFKEVFQSDSGEDDDTTSSATVILEVPADFSQARKK
ncbi:hypothetical protein IT570_05620 [Candidatus Sumerlaeota bacterium]|nr:hypothetical protein [Candidatus Sumerlaeota bacterium]